MSSRFFFFFSSILSISKSSRPNNHQNPFVMHFDGDWDALKKHGQQAVLKEIDHSLKPLTVNITTVTDVEDMTALLLQHQELFTVLILNNKLFVSKRFLADRKYFYHVVFARSALDLKPIPNMIYQFEDGASGSANRFHCIDKKDDNKYNRLLLDIELKRNDPDYRQRFGNVVPPRLSIAKREGYTPCGLLCPNPYIQNISSFALNSFKLEDAATSHPFEDRDERLFWRGHIRGRNGKYPNHCKSESGNYARLSAASLTSERPDLFDIRCTKCEPRDANLYPCSHLPYDAAMNWSIYHLSNTIHGEYIDQINFTRYQHFLNLPGSTSGSYSRNLNNLWILGGIVFLWQSAHVEWYYPALINGVTHITVNRSNAINMLQMIRHNKSLTDRLRTGARLIHDTYFCPDCFASYFEELLLRLRRKFNFHFLFDDPNRLVNFFKTRVDCNQFVQIDGKKHNRIRFYDLSDLSCTEIFAFAMGSLPVRSAGGRFIKQIEVSI